MKKGANNDCCVSTAFSSGEDGCGLKSAMLLLMECTGFTGKALFMMLHEDQNVYSVSQDSFFQPFRSTGDPFLRAASIITAPILLSVAAVGMAVASIMCAFASLGALAFSGKKGAKGVAQLSGALFLVSGVTLIAAVSSPIINFIDLVGSAITTASRACSVELSY